MLLSAGALALTAFAAVTILATGSADEFASWAWARHHNVLSWYIRPLFLLPFCYFAYQRSLFGITLTLLGLATSMFWFPAPARVSPAASEMLASEQTYLLGEWTLWKVLIALIVPVTFTALALAFWKRSFAWGLAVINGMVLIKIGWTFVFATEAGALAHLTPAVLGLAVVDAVIVYFMRARRTDSSHPQGGSGQSAARG